jgi:DNA-binding MarR family transcriptional regulator
MADPAMTEHPPLLTPRTIGETENALRALLTSTLAGTGLDYPRWVTLTIVARSRSPIPATELITRLTGSLKIDRNAVTALVDDLRARHILEQSGDTVTITAQGTALHQRLNTRVEELTGQLWAGLDANDLASAHRVHTTITDRANQLLARHR